MKVDHQRRRPFFTNEEILTLEEELGIGLCSYSKYNCNGCGISHDKVRLFKCSGCYRVWYCGQECSEIKWSNHKHNCGNKGANKWRTKASNFTAETLLGFDEIKQSAMETGVLPIRLGDASMIFLCVGINGGDDDDGIELFDGWTDRPYTFKRPPSYENRLLVDV